MCKSKSKRLTKALHTATAHALQHHLEQDPHHQDPRRFAARHPHQEARHRSKVYAPSPPPLYTN